VSIVVSATPTVTPVITAPQRPVHVATSMQSIGVVIPTGKPGPKGDPGEDAQWDSMTQAEFDDLPTKDPATLYVIIG
jgi:hypothetical protein